MKQIHMEQEKVVKEIRQTTDILANIRWKAIASEDETSNCTETETEVEEGILNGVTTRAADDL